METIFDSTADTLKHIKEVNKNIIAFCTDMLHRATMHDNSKLSFPEKMLLDLHSQELYSHPYNSDGYKAVLAKMKVGVDHHNANNSHHPAYYENGVDGMNLFDLVEMFCDIQAATTRVPDTSLLKSMEANKEKYNLSPQLYSILVNTINYIDFKEDFDEFQNE